MDAYEEATITGLLAQMEQGTLKFAQLTRWYLQRIEHLYRGKGALKACWKEIRTCWPLPLSSRRNARH